MQQASSTSPRSPQDRRQHVWGLLIVIGLAVLVLAKDLATFWLIGDRPRDWDYGTQPQIPAQTYPSTRPPRPGPAPRQVELPPSAPIHRSPR